MKNELQELFKLAAKFFLKQYKAEGGAQSTLAKELGITQSYFSSVANGSRTASLDLYNQIAEKLYGPLDKFLAVGRRMKDGLEPLEEKEKMPEDPIENLIARLTYYVVDHQRIEKELSSLKHFFENIVENLQSGILVMDKEHKVVYSNSYMYKMAYIPTDIIVGTSPYDAGKKIPGLEISEFTQKYTDAFEQRQPLSYNNIKTIIPSGDTLFLCGSLTPLFRDGTFDGMICSISDTTSSYILKNLLIETLNNSSHGIVILQQTAPGEMPEIYYMNKQFKDNFGLEQIDPLLVPFSETLDLITKSLKNSKTWQNFINKSIGSNLTKAHFIMNLKNGKSYNWECSPLVDDTGVHWGRIATVKKNQQKSRKRK